MQEETKNPFERLARSERETHFSLMDDENTWSCYTNIPRDMRKLELQGWAKKIVELYPDGTPMAITFEAPRRAITIGKAEKAKREMTKEQLLASQNRAKKMQEAKANKKLKNL